MSLECNNTGTHNVIKTIPIFIFPIHCNSKNTYYEKNRDKILNKYHERKNEISYYEKNKEKILNKYYENKEERLKYQIEYNLHHKDDLKERNIQFVNETLCMMVYNIANHIDLEKSLDFIWEFIDESNEEITDYFDNYKNSKLKLDYMDYSSYKGTEEINTLIKMVYSVFR